MRQERIGILGGTFQPIHNGHLLLAKHAKDVLSLDRVLFLIDRIPPHKE
ncbi:MAG: adenylyltransferase/cytidyltransferase family protein, partial [Clostridia bacterium]|nr:adenylyltransferase/cytidyltransferase family protein [Clostridia bacterium]